MILRSTLLLIALMILHGCSGSQSTLTEESENDAIRVLMVTATHGFRHTPAIEAAHVMAEKVNQADEFQIVVTEDINDFNSENLATYDVLFFANSTLRVANDLSAEEEEAVADPLKGDWGNWDFEYDGRRGKIEGKLALSGTPGDLTGNIQYGNNSNPIELADVNLDGDQLSIGWRRGNSSPSIVATIDGGSMEGVLVNGDNEVPVTGTRTGPNEVDVAEESRVNAAHRAAIQEFVQSGKGVVVAHAGLDAFYEWDWYKEMVGGGLFVSHPWTQSVGITIEEKDNPAVAHFGSGFEIHDEIYVLDQNPRWNARVLASLDMQSVGIEEGPADPSQNDHPISWIRKHDGGKIFVTKLGHFAEVWQDPGYQTHLLEGIKMVAGRTPASFTGHRVKEVIAENVWPDDIAVDEKGNVWIVELRGKIHYYDAEAGETRQIGELPNHRSYRNRAWCIWSRSRS